MDEKRVIGPDIEGLLREATFQASRSSGKGGQHVNKVSTRMTLTFDVMQSAILTEAQKNAILQKLKTRITGQGILKIDSQHGRSQLQNKNKTIEKFTALIISSLKKRKKRKPSLPPEGVNEARLQKKRNCRKRKRSGRINGPTEQKN